MISLRRIPMSWVIGVALALALAGGVAWLRADAYRRGELAAKRAPLESAIKMGAVRITADSAEHERIEKTLTVVASPKSDRAVLKYSQGRVRVLALPDSAMSTIRVTNAFEADTAIMTLVAERSLLRQLVKVDSLQIQGLRVQVARYDSLNAIVVKEKKVRCGQKCGLVIGAAATGLLAAILTP